MTRRWDPADREAVSGAAEVAVSPRCANGTLRPATTIWVVRVGDDLYVRSYRGPSGGWYRAALASKEGRIEAGGVERDVSFEDPPGDVLERVDDAYRAKYGHSSYVDAMLAPQAQATTLRLVPR
jgi:hypothetical protein